MKTRIQLMLRFCTAHFSHTTKQPLQPLKLLHSKHTLSSQTHHSRSPFFTSFIQQKQFFSTTTRTHQDIQINTNTPPSTSFIQSIVSIVLFGNQFLKGSRADLKLNNIHNAPSFFVEGKHLTLNEWYHFVLNSGGKEIILGKEGTKLVLISHHIHSNQTSTFIWKFNNHYFESSRCEYEKYLKWKSVQLGAIRETLQVAVQRSRDVALRHNTPQTQSLTDAEEVLNSGLAEKTISRLTVSQNVPVNCLYEPIGRVALQVLQAAYYSLNFFENNQHNKSTPNNHHHETEKDVYFPHDPTQINNHLMKAVEDAILVSTNYIVDTSFNLSNK